MRLLLELNVKEEEEVLYFQTQYRDKPQLFTISYGKATVQPS